MGTLILNSLEIRNFRCFKHLQIERLGRVNLIVGKNNVGKSSFLEALALYASRGNPRVIWQLLEQRYEGEDISSARYEDLNELLVSLKYLFYDRRDIRREKNTLPVSPITIGSAGSLEEKLIVSIEWSTSPTLIVQIGDRISKEIVSRQLF